MVRFVKCAFCFIKLLLIFYKIFLIFVSRESTKYIFESFESFEGTFRWSCHRPINGMHRNALFGQKTTIVGNCAIDQSDLTTSIIVHLGFSRYFSVFRRWRKGNSCTNNGNELRHPNFFKLMSPIFTLGLPKLTVMPFTKLNCIW